MKWPFTWPAIYYFVDGNNKGIVDFSFIMTSQIPTESHSKPLFLLLRKGFISCLHQQYEQAKINNPLRGGLETWRPSLRADKTQA